VEAADDVVVVDADDGEVVWLPEVVQPARATATATAPIHPR